MFKKSKGLTIFCALIFVNSFKSVFCQGNPCISDLDCTGIHEKLVCQNDSQSCECPPNHYWLDSTCLLESDSEDDLIADLVTIFAPLLTFGIFFVIVFIFCCITMFRPNNTMASSKTKYIDESESKMKRFNVETGEMDSLTMDKRSNSAGSARYTELNELPIRNIIKDTQGRVRSAGMSRPKISIDLAPSKKVEEIEPDAGYQATMKLLFDRSAATSSEPNSRPISAISYQPGFYRSESATNMTRQTSLTLLVPRESTRPSSATSLAGRRSPVVTGPYLTDPSTLRLLQKRSDKLSPTNFIGLQNSENLIETSFIEMDVVVNKNQNQDSSKARTFVKKNSESEKKKDENVETKILHKAVNAFKQKKRLKDFPKEEASKKLETVVEKIMRIRTQQSSEDTSSNKKSKATKPRVSSAEEKISLNPNPGHSLKKSKNVSKSEQSSPSRRVSFYDELSSLGSVTSSLSDTTGKSNRPESVAQRILRERKEKNIVAKVPETPEMNQEKFKKDSGKVVNPPRKPLHVALKETASKKEFSRETTKEKIKEEVRFNAVLNFEVPPLPEGYFMTVNEIKKKGLVKGKSDSRDKPIKSILKNTSAKEHSTEKPMKEVISKNPTLQVVAQVY